MKYITNFLSNSKFKRYFILILLFVLFILVSAISYTNAVCMNISDSVFRLHVVANSNTEEDQNLKYIVRDSIINYINEISQDATSKEEIIKITQNHLYEIEQIATQTVKDLGFNYSITLEVGNFAFPSKQYGDITLPPGYYDALKINIGEAKGQNWWCVMFPPLCFVDVTSGIVPDESKEIMQDNLSTEEYDLISKKSSDIEIKFKIVEVLQNFTISGIFM